MLSQAAGALLPELFEKGETLDPVERSRPLAGRGRELQVGAIRGDGARVVAELVVCLGQQTDTLGLDRRKRMTVGALEPGDRVLPGASVQELRKPSRCLVSR